MHTKQYADDIVIYYGGKEFKQKVLKKLML